MMQEPQGDENRSREKYLHLLPHPPKVALWALSSFLLVLSLSYLVGMYKTYKDIRAERKTISISAEGKVLAAPDLASLTVSVVTDGKDSKAVSDENTKKVNAILDFVKSKGIKSDDLETANYALVPKYYYPYDYPRIPCPAVSDVVPPVSFPCPPKYALIVGYELNQSVNVKVRDFSVLGDIISGSIERGANQVSGVNFSIEDPDKIKNEARQKAIESARARAEDLARTAGIGLGKVLTFSEGNLFYPQPVYMNSGVAISSEKTAGVPAPRIEPGTQEVSVTMNVTFELDQ